jgi:hypothetical protein
MDWGQMERGEQSVLSWCSWVLSRRGTRVRNAACRLRNVRRTRRSTGCGAWGWDVLTCISLDQCPTHTHTHTHTHTKHTLNTHSLSLSLSKQNANMYIALNIHSAWKWKVWNRTFFSFEEIAGFIFKYGFHSRTFTLNFGQFVIGSMKEYQCIQNS